MKQSRQQLIKSYQKGKMYPFVVTNERTTTGCQIVQDSLGGKHLLTKSDKDYPVGKAVRLVVMGFSHTPSAVTSSYYLILSPKKKSEAASKKTEPFSGKCLVPRKNKKTGFNQSFLNKKYKTGNRYLFVVVDGSDAKGRQFVEDSFGIKHVLVTNSNYDVGVNVRCTVTGISDTIHPITQNFFMTLTMPRIVNQTKAVKKYVRSPEQWYPEVQGLDMHESGRQFTCGCCGQDFPGRMGFRVELKDVYFCKACARKIFEPKARGNRPVLIYTPMGNKR